MEEGNSSQNEYGLKRRYVSTLTCEKSKSNPFAQGAVVEAAIGSC